MTQALDDLTPVLLDLLSTYCIEHGLSEDYKKFRDLLENKS